MEIFRKRIVAYIMDYFVISSIMWVLSQIVAFIVFSYSTFLVYNYLIFVLPVLTLIYFVILEKIKGETVGKNLMGLKVVNEYNGNISYKSSIIRNISKIYFLPILIDLVIGRFSKGDNERILGKASKTVVIEE
ncbi:MAG: RDD family protein [Methanobacteriaceae archaeon]